MLFCAMRQKEFCKNLALVDQSESQNHRRSRERGNP
jgi:hypothetical protein